MKESNHEIMMDLHVFSPQDYEKVVSVMPPVCMGVCPANTRMVGQNYPYSAFKSLSILGESEHPTSNNWGPSNEPQNTKRPFSRKLLG
jgi:hypothetical protein